MAKAYRRPQHGAMRSKPPRVEIHGYVSESTSVKSGKATHTNHVTGIIHTLKVDCEDQRHTRRERKLSIQASIPSFRGFGKNARKKMTRKVISDLEALGFRDIDGALIWQGFEDNWHRLRAKLPTGIKYA